MPYLLMSISPQPAVRSIFLARSANEFSGFCTAVKRRIPFLGITAAVTILSRFLPMLMSNIGYTQQQTYPSFLICSGMSIAILGIMILTLIGSMVFINFPNLPVDLRTVAGMGWYVVVDAKNNHNTILPLVEGLRRGMMAELESREQRDRRADELGWRIGYDDRAGLLYVVEEGAKMGGDASTRT
ncbi:hypothetical protein QBC44DRAFT_64264 [Cladorrhinum sp. PSN332]|nr:hypothetical protein QBC44DRAFT_64264 [Cladorrhinum sp. PSN332]